MQSVAGNQNLPVVMARRAGIILYILDSIDQGRADHSAAFAIKANSKTQQDHFLFKAAHESRIRVFEAGYGAYEVTDLRGYLFNAISQESVWAVGHDRTEDECISELFRRGSSLLRPDYVDQLRAHLASNKPPALKSAMPKFPSTPKTTPEKALEDAEAKKGKGKGVGAERGDHVAERVDEPVAEAVSTGKIRVTRNRSKKAAEEADLQHSDANTKKPRAAVGDPPDNEDDDDEIVTAEPNREVTHGGDSTSEVVATENSKANTNTKKAGQPSKAKHNKVLRDQPDRDKRHHHSKGHEKRPPTKAQTAKGPSAKRGRLGSDAAPKSKKPRSTAKPNQPPVRASSSGVSQPVSGDHDRPSGQSERLHDEAVDHFIKGIRRMHVKITAATNALFINHPNPTDMCRFPDFPGPALEPLYIRVLRGGLDRNWKARAVNLQQRRVLQPRPFFKALIWAFLCIHIFDQQEVPYDAPHKYDASDEAEYVRASLQERTHLMLFDVLHRASRIQLEAQKFINEVLTPLANDMAADLLLAINPHIEVMSPIDTPTALRLALPTALNDICSDAFLLLARMKGEKDEYEVKMWADCAIDMTYMVADEDSPEIGGHVAFTTMPAMLQLEQMVSGGQVMLIQRHKETDAEPEPVSISSDGSDSTPDVSAENAEKAARIKKKSRKAAKLPAATTAAERQDVPNDGDDDEHGSRNAAERGEQEKGLLDGVDAMEEMEARNNGEALEQNESPAQDVTSDPPLSPPKNVPSPERPTHMEADSSHSASEWVSANASPPHPKKRVASSDKVKDRLVRHGGESQGESPERPPHPESHQKKRMHSSAFDDTGADGSEEDDQPPGDTIVVAQVRHGSHAPQIEDTSVKVGDKGLSPSSKGAKPLGVVKKSKAVRRHAGTGGDGKVHEKKNKKVSTHKPLKNRGPVLKKARVRRVYSSDEAQEVLQLMAQGKAKEVVARNREKHRRPVLKKAHVRRVVDSSDDAQENVQLMAQEKEKEVVDRKSEKHRGPVVKKAHVRRVVDSSDEVRSEEEYLGSDEMDLSDGVGGRGSVKGHAGAATPEASDGDVYDEEEEEEEDNESD